MNLVFTFITSSVSVIKRQYVPIHFSIFCLHPLYSHSISKFSTSAIRLKSSVFLASWMGIRKQDMRQIPILYSLYTIRYK